MSKLLNILWAALCLAAAVFGIVMLVMAIRFGEYGRVVFYFGLTVVSASISLYPILKLRAK